jgi:outer membrane receptor protein involved in Fe transport
MSRKILLFIFFSLSINLVYGQTGTIRGRITDAIEEGVIGANVVIEGTQIGGSTDIDGNFNIFNVNPGTYNISISYIGYKPKVIEGVVVYSGKITTLNSVLEEDASLLEDIVIEATRETFSEISVISEIRLSQVVAVGVSGEQIAKTQDSDGAAVLKRLPGISLFDERFIMVRGLGERYNAVLLNGALTPSTEVDVKSFSFDVIPSSVIDRMLVLKSGAPSLPGEYAGGIIQIFTKNAPDENFTNISISGGVRLKTTFATLQKYEGGSTDWLGFDDGTRRLPGNFPTNSQLEGNRALGAEAARQLSSTWLPKSFNAAPDFKISLGLGRRFRIGEAKIGNLTSISYGNSRQFLKIKRDRYASFDPNEQRITDFLFDYNDEQSNQTVRIGAIHNWSMTLGNSKIEFRNLFNQLGSTQTTFRQGVNRSNSAEVQNYSLYYENRSIYSGQLAGQHSLGSSSSIDWIAGYSYTNRQEPDFRRIRTQRSIGSEDPFTVPFVVNNLSFQQNGRFFSNLNEHAITFGVNFEKKFRYRGSEDSPIVLKLGTYLEKKNRDFKSRILTLATADPSRSEVNIDFAFDPTNIAPNLFYLFDGTTPDYIYNASNSLNAGYVSINIPFSEKWNLTTGVRVEYNDQRLETEAIELNSNPPSPVRVKNQITSFFPSLNLTFNMSDKMLLRAAYGGSINRPEFRELSPFLYYDFNADFLVQGDPKLKTPKIYNADLRWEYYPTPAETITIGVFYKRFENPIEIAPIDPNSPTPLMQFFNADQANSYGVELEIRKSLGSILPALDNVSLVANASYIYNRVRLPSRFENQVPNRPMMNQSPYLINTGFYYNNKSGKLQASVLYNVFGRRLYYAGDVKANPFDGNYPPAYEMPRNTIDLSLSFGIWSFLELKLGVNDLLNARYRFVQDSNRDGKITDIDDDLISYRRGQLFSTSLKISL